MRTRNTEILTALPGILSPTRRLPSICILLFSACLLLLCFGCERQNRKTPPVVRLDKLTSLPEPPQELHSDALRVAVAAILSPQGTIESYQSLVNYLKSKTGKNVVLVQRRTYQETNELLARNAVDVAFVCTGAYLKDKEHMELLVVPQIDGKITYRSLLIVPSLSPATGMRDLRGKVFAFTDPLSNSGYLYPVSLLQRIGEAPERFFARTIFTYSHDRSISAVMEGIADGAAVDSIIYAFFAKRPLGTTGTKVIWQSEEFGMPPIVVPRGIDPRQKEALKTLFLNMGQESDGQNVLTEMGIDRFVVPKPNLYGFSDSQDPC